MASRQPEGDVFGGAQVKRELTEARRELDECKTYLAGVLELIQARTGDYQKTDRFCIQCHKQYLHSGPDNCQCVCHAAVAYIKSHPTMAQIKAAEEAEEELKRQAATLAAMQDEGQAEDAEHSET